MKKIVFWIWLLVLSIFGVVYAAQQTITLDNKTPAYAKLSFSDSDFTDDATDKMNSYITIRNGLDIDLNDSINNYLDRASWDAGPKLTDIPVDWDLVKFDINNIDIKNFDKSIKSNPKLKFDQIAKKYISALKAMLLKNNELYNYYHTQAYKKDKNLVKAKKLHKEFTKIISQYDNTYPEFKWNYDIWFALYQQNQLKEYQTNNELAKYAVENISLSKKLLMDEVDRLDTSINNGDTLNTDKLSDLLVKYSQVVSAASGVNDQSVINKDFGSYAYLFDYYKSDAESLRANAQKILDLLKAYDPKNSNLGDINNLFDDSYDIEDDMIDIRNQLL